MSAEGDFGVEAALGELREKVEAVIEIMQRIEGRLESLEAALVSDSPEKGTAP